MEKKSRIIFWVLLPLTLVGYFLFIRPATLLEQGEKDINQRISFEKNTPLNQEYFDGIRKLESAAKYPWYSSRANQILNRSAYELGMNYYETVTTTVLNLSQQSLKKIQDSINNNIHDSSLKINFLHQQYDMYSEAVFAKNIFRPDLCDNWIELEKFCQFWMGFNNWIYESTGEVAYHYDYMRMVLEKHSPTKE